MLLVDAWAASAATIAAVALGLRGNMLKPDHDAWAPAPTYVWVSIMALAILLGMGVINIAEGAHATPREAVIYSALAVGSLIMVVNLQRNGRSARGLLATLHGRAGLIRTLETRMDPQSVALFRQFVERAAAEKKAASDE